nr:trifunctional UDP-glucose 4,6-dehydratase/UDP-4-keto-6-deoxy-D-glucose 3,5-epimerase/UDP-4-keto-L-rhamnose-reductase RHM1 [Ipomoea batatas]
MANQKQQKHVKFLIYGKTGMIGGMLGKLCEEKGIPFEYGKARLEDRSGLVSDMTRVNPTHVFNAAGATGTPNVDWCEFNKVETIRSNVIGALNLADVCEEKGILLLYFGTGCMFDYDSEHPMGSGLGFTEQDKSNYAGSFYSKTKGMLEDLLGEYNNICILRVRMPLLSDLNHPRVITHNEVLELYKKYVDPGLTWTNFTLEEQRKVLAAPRCNNELNSSKLKLEFPELLGVKESIIKYVFEPNTKK